MDAEARIKALEERTDLLEIAVWSLEKSDERNWKIFGMLDNDLHLIAEATGVNLGALRRFMDEAKRRLRTDSRES